MLDEWVERCQVTFVGYSNGWGLQQADNALMLVIIIHAFFASDPFGSGHSSSDTASAVLNIYHTADVAVSALMLHLHTA